jgi:hypothetical protein
MWATKFHTHIKQQAKLYLCKQEVPNFHIYFVCENVYESQNVR